MTITPVVAYRDENYYQKARFPNAVVVEDPVRPFWAPAASKAEEERVGP